MTIQSKGILPSLLAKAPTSSVSQWTGAKREGGGAVSKPQEPEAVLRCRDHSGAPATVGRVGVQKV